MSGDFKEKLHQFNEAILDKSEPNLFMDTYIVHPSALKLFEKEHFIIQESGDGVREHRGGLEESLKTSKYISKEEFEKLKSKYKWYGYDGRCEQNMYIAKDIENEQYTWLFIEG